MYGTLFEGTVWRGKSHVGQSQRGQRRWWEVDSWSGGEGEREGGREMRRGLLCYSQRDGKLVIRHIQRLLESCDTCISDIPITHKAE